MPGSLYRELVRLGWPVLVAQLAVMANNVIDTIMAGRYGTLDLAAVGIGSSIYFSVFVALMGVLLALTPIAAHLYGAGRHAEIGEQLPAPRPGEDTRQLDDADAGERLVDHQNAAIPVIARPRINAWTSCAPS